MSKGITKEEAIKLLVNATYSDEWQGNEDLTAAHNMAIEALEIVEEFEKAQIISSGRLNGRTYAYKCGLDDGKRKALKQQPSEDCVSRKAMLDAITEIDENINMDIYTNEVREIIRELQPVTPARKKARWIKHYTAFVNDDNQIVTECYCTNCCGISYFRSMCEKLVGANYCPNCGAEMESKK